MAFEFSTRFTKGSKYSLTGGTRCKALSSFVPASAPAFSNSYSAHLDGTNDVIRTTFNTGDVRGDGTGYHWGNGFTMSGWFMFDSDCADNIRISGTSANNRCYVYYVRSTGKMHFMLGSKTGSTADLSLTAGVWHHFAITTTPTTGYTWSGWPGPYGYSGGAPYYHTDGILYVNGTNVREYGVNGTGWSEAVWYLTGSQLSLDGAINASATSIDVDAPWGTMSWGASDPKIGYIGDEQILFNTSWVNATTTYTIVRAQNGTTATAHADGAKIFHSRNDLVFGALYQTWPYFYFWKGKLDEMAVWDEPLTSTEVTAIYNSGTPIDLASDSGNYASSANLQGYWRFEENTGTSIADSSTNSNTGTLLNGAAFSSDNPSD
jgi:hypothetical protein